MDTRFNKSRFSSKEALLKQQEEQKQVRSYQYI
jgi:hypothetical protein